MKNIKWTLRFCSLLFVAHTAQAQIDPDAVEVKKYTIANSEGVEKQLAPFADIRFGSGLVYKRSKRSGAIEFYIASDGLISLEQQKREVPVIGIVEVKPEQATITSLLLVETNNAFPGKLDIEGVAVGANKSIWLSDEATPAIFKVDSNTGKVRAVYSPPTNLPEELLKREDNRGFEGITLNARGEIFAVMQSVLEVDDESGEQALFIRLIKFNPTEEKATTYAYPIDVETFGAGNETRLSALQAIDNERLLISERGPAKDGRYVNRVYILDLADASELPDGKDVSNPLESIRKPEELFGVGNPIERAVQKELLLDLRDIGWPYEKAEGLALLPDGKTLVIVNDPMDDAEENAIWFVTLPESLIPWSWSDWLLLVLLSFLGIISFTFLLAVILSEFRAKKES